MWAASGWLSGATPSVSTACICSASAKMPFSWSSAVADCVLAHVELGQMGDAFYVG